MSTLAATYAPTGTPEPPDFTLLSESNSSYDTSIPSSQPAQACLPEETQKPRWKYQPTKVKFDPAVHCAIEEPAWRKKLTDFGYDTEDGISEIGATAAFQLFTEEAVKLMRNDMLSEPVQENHVYSSKRSAYQVRGYAPSKSKFIYDAWHSPEVLDAVSRAAGIELVPLMDYEIGHANIQLGPKGPDGVRELSSTPSLPLPSTEKLPPSKYDDRPVDDWHYDGTPFVAVLMVSNTTGMDGGETAVMGKDGRIEVVPGPAMGKVVVMQGSCLKHAALRSKNCSERIALVTSLRPKDPMIYDMSHLRNVWGSSDRRDLGYQWMTYRMKVLEDRLRIQRERLTRDWDLKDVQQFAASIEEYLKTTVNEVSQE